MLKCPYCDSEIPNDVPICPHCMAELKTNVKVVHINTGGFNNINNNSVNEEIKSKKSYTKYYIAIVTLTVVLGILSTLIIFKLKPVKEEPYKYLESPTTSTPLKEMTFNKGVFSGKENPLKFGNMTIASIYDPDANVTKMVDVMITRYLTDNEVTDILSRHNSPLKEGFTFVGIEYNVYFHDLAYLGNKSLNPVLQASILENKFFNDYFLVDGHYYKNEIFSEYNGPNIKNEETATIKMVYQVPIGQNYYICFGSDVTNLGCFSN